MTEGEYIECRSCGTRLARVVTPRQIDVDGTRFPFARRTDHLTCPECGDVESIWDLRGDLPDAAVAIEALHDLNEDVGVPDAPTRDTPDSEPDPAA